MIGLLRPRTIRGRLQRLLLPAVIVAMLASPQPAQARAGDLDPSYGTGGISPHGAGGVFTLPDGRIISGSVRLNTDGSLDTSFGSSGNGSLDPVLGVRPHVSSIQRDGKLLAPVQTRNYHYMVARYTADGRLDPTFGREGLVHVASIYHQGAWRAQVPGDAFAALAAPDGSIVAAGRMYLSYPCGVWWVLPVFCTTAVDTIVRIGADGTPDPRTFAIPAWTQIFEGYSYSTETLTPLVGLALDDIGRLYACGQLAEGRMSQLIRFTAAGAVDPTFAAEPSPGDSCGSIYPFVDEAAGSRGVLLGGPGPIVRRLLESGLRDPSFGQNGAMDISVGKHPETYVTVAKMVGGKVVLTARTPQRARGFVARLDGSGNSDPTFGINGIALLDRELQIADLGSFAAQPDGKLVIGRYYGGTIRLLGDEPQLSPREVQ